jgi:hypothetical protein
MVAMVTVTGLSLHCLFPERSQVTESWLLPRKPSHRGSKENPKKTFFFAKCFYLSYLFNWELVTPLFPIIPGPYILIFIISNQPSMLLIFFELPTQTRPSTSAPDTSIPNASQITALDGIFEQLSQMVNVRDKAGCWAMQSWFVGWGSHALRKDKKFAHHILY